MSLARRSLTSVSWTMGSNACRLTVLFFRAVALARLIPVAVFGVFGLSYSILALTLVFAQFGLHGAFMHRCPETEDEDHAARHHFTIHLITGSIWYVCAVLFTLIFASGDLRTCLLVHAITFFLHMMTTTPRAILARRVQFKRLAILEVTQAVLATGVAIGLALAGAGIWALLSVNMVITLINVVGLFVIRPVWRPRLAFERKTVKYFLRFGSRSVTAVILRMALDRLDDLWTAVALGTTSLGYYSRAYTFANYPTTLLSPPITTVAGGTYAELKKDRRRLSMAFFRTTAYLIRSGFLLAGLVVLAAPEFITIVLSEKWLPMLTAFRLMIIFSLLDPVLVSCGKVFIAMGNPMFLVKARLAQLAVLVGMLWYLVPLYDIAGVALAVDTMCVVGVVILLTRIREYVDFSTRRLFLWPFVCLAIASAATLGAMSAAGTDHSLWFLLAMKSGVYVSVYAGLLLALERKEVLVMFQRILKAVRPKNVTVSEAIAPDEGPEE